MWDAFKKCPIIILAGTVTWFSNDFFLAKVPNVARMVDKNPDQSNLSAKQFYLQNKTQSLPK